MDTRSIPHAPAIEGEMRLPLPGLYPCLAWQLNVTLHGKQGLAKFVSVLREPSDHVEICRSFADLNDWAGVAQTVLAHTEQTMDDMGYLQGLPWRKW